MKVSIIIPVYNVNKYLSECLKSVQMIKSNVEIILVDDCGSENPNEIIKPFLLDGRFALYKNSKNVGLGESRNVGMRHISTETTHVFFLDSDDFISAKNFDYEFSKLKKNVNRIVYGFEYYFRNKIVLHHGNEIPKHSNGFPFSAAGTFWASKFLTDFWLTSYEDAPWTLKISNKNPASENCELSIIYYRQRLSSITNSRPTLKMLENYLLNKQFCRENGGMHPRLFTFNREWEKYFMLKKDERKKIASKMPAIKMGRKFLLWFAILMQKITFFNKWNTLFSRRGYFE